MTITLLLAVAFLAFGNGANDNFKGVATLYGSGAATFRQARAWATAATVAGSLASLFLAASLMKAFSGRGLVPDEVADAPALMVSVGAASAVTILLATRLGMPTSTTHALTGALAGIAVLVSGGAAPLGRLWGGFLLPLLVSPPLALVLGGGAFLVLHRARAALGISRDACVCAGPEPAVVPLSVSGAAAPAAERWTVTAGTTPACVERYGGRVVGVEAQSAVSVVHFLSAGAVCFARAVNDTPKIAALLAAAGHGGVPAMAVVAAAMAVGGWLGARRVAETMSKGIADLNPGQGLAGNLVTAGLVIVASRWGVPVSTTHVSVGSILGVGVARGAARWGTVRNIVLAWVTTLPLAAVLGAGFFWVLSRLA